MARPLKGDVVVVPFPFSDLTQAKRRPALVLAGLEGNDLILCQITSRTVSDGYAVGLSDADFAQGGLRLESNIRPNRLFTADHTIVLYRVGSLVPAKPSEVVDRVVSILRT
ncbi:type II toxin-antitoxin system PemK/MazF family toxin [candidate division WOR-3 bacterium]|nr:type II toxin-antitoxin system PemK/MazF family toxin [candidate division WOR-3 bacterium]